MAMGPTPSAPDAMAFSVPKDIQNHPVRNVDRGRQREMWRSVAVGDAARRRAAPGRVGALAVDGPRLRDDARCSRPRPRARPSTGTCDWSWRRCGRRSGSRRSPSGTCTWWRRRRPRRWCSDTGARGGDARRARSWRGGSAAEWTTMKAADPRAWQRALRGRVLIAAALFARVGRWHRGAARLAAGLSAPGDARRGERPQGPHAHGPAAARRHCRPPGAPAGDQRGRGVDLRGSPRASTTRRPWSGPSAGRWATARRERAGRYIERLSQKIA